ncbi:MAG: hypothetical protein ACRDJW_04770 [Thermomicrobiales bacterium]
MTPDDDARMPPRIAVVGPCASGKSTLVEGLRQLGFDAYVCGQEHSEISTLWRHGNPTAVVFLEVDLGTIRRRRGSDWPADLFAAQLRRLENAREVALLIIDARMLPPMEVLSRAAEALGASESLPTNWPR